LNLRLWDSVAIIESSAHTTRWRLQRAAEAAEGADPDREGSNEAGREKGVLLVGGGVGPRARGRGTRREAGGAGEEGEEDLHGRGMLLPEVADVVAGGVVEDRLVEGARSLTMTTTTLTLCWGLPALPTP
jgi:hypothetical protein